MISGLLRVVLLASIVLVALGWNGTAKGQPSERANPTRSQAELEQAFTNTLSGAMLVGHFTDSSEKSPFSPHEERYFLQRVRKLESGLWLIQARIQYGEHDLTLPLTLPIEWAGDTPVIQVNKLPIPGLGTFSARVLIHEGYYAGYWRAVDHGGHLFGLIERIKQEPSSGD
jgi:hypothetical protein